MMKHKILLSTIAASLLMFSGCGGSSDNDTTQTVSGVVADGYIKGANVFLDLNCNGIQDSGEISTTTDENGNYSLNTNVNIAGACIVSQGGFDTERNVSIKTLLIAPAVSDANVTPLTTMAYKYSVDNNTSYEDATTQLAEKLNIDPKDFTADPEKITTIKTVTTQIQSAVDLIVDANNSIDPKELYTTIATNIVATSGEVNLSEALTKDMPISDTLKEAVVLTTTKVEEMVQNDDFSDYAAVNDALVEAVTNNTNITNLEDYVDYVANTISQDIVFAKSNIEALQSTIIDLNTTASSKTATVTDAKNMIANIRDTIHEFVDTNIEDQENNTSTVVGSLIDNYNNSLTPSINDISTALNNISQDIDSSFTQFDVDVSKDFNNTMTVLSNRLDAIAQVLNRYEENESFSDVNTTYGDILSHTYEQNSDGIVTSTYTINNQTITNTYPTTSEDISQISVNGAISLSDENYSLNITSLSFRDFKLSLVTNGQIKGENNSLITGNINISTAINGSDLIDGYIYKSFSNLNVSINGDIKTSTNKEFQGIYSLTDTKLELSGKYVDVANNIQLDGNISVNTNDTLWKEYLDDKDKTMDWLDTTLVTLNNKLVINYQIDWSNNDVNLTTFDGTLYQCQVEQFWPNLDGLTCEGNPSITKTTTTDLEGKILTFTVNGQSFVVDDINVEWDYVSNNVEKASLNIDSSSGYNVYYDNSFILNANDVEQNVTSISYNIENPINVEQIYGGIKFIGNVKDNNISASLSLAVTKDSNDTIYYIDNLSLVANNLDISAPNLLKLVVSNDQINDINLNEFNATVTDINGYNAKLINVIYNAASNDSNTSEFYGQISYMNTTFTGYASVKQSATETIASIYADVSKEGFEPFTIMSDTEVNASGANSLILIKKGDYEIGGTFVGNDTQDNLKLYDTNGIFFNLETMYSSNSDEDNTTITLTDKDGNKLADINSSVNNWEIIYSDNVTETLY